MAPISCFLSYLVVLYRFHYSFSVQHLVKLGWPRFANLAKRKKEAELQLQINISTVGCCSLGAIKPNYCNNIMFTSLNRHTACQMIVSFLIIFIFCTKIHVSCGDCIQCVLISFPVSVKSVFKRCRVWGNHDLVR